MRAQYLDVVDGHVARPACVQGTQYASASFTHGGVWRQLSPNQRFGVVSYSATGSPMNVQLDVLDLKERRLAYSLPQGYRLDEVYDDGPSIARVAGGRQGALVAPGRAPVPLWEDSTYEWDPAHGRVVAGYSLERPARLGAAACKLAKSRSIPAALAGP